MPRTSSSNGVGDYESNPRGHRGRLEGQIDALAVNGGSQHPDKRRAGGHGPTLADQIERELPTLLPTPSASRFNDGEDPETWQARHDFHALKAEGATWAGKPLTIAAMELMPTPSAANAHGNDVNGRGEQLLPGAVIVNFGQYEAAIRRAEDVAGRDAPTPTKPDGKGGAHRLSSEFVEWMMLLPAGHVTGHGIGRNPELARLGNGVVPLQAAYGVREALMQAFGGDR